MAATNFTPIQLYHSTTASAAPTAANLAQGELAINITDGKLYYEDNGGVVQVLATKGTGSIGGTTTQIQFNNAGALAGNAAMTFNSGTSTTTLTTLNLTNALGATHGGTSQSAYAQGDFLYASATNTLAKLGIGTVNFILTSTGSVPQWVAPSSVTVQTANNLAGGLAGSVPFQSAADTTTFLAIGAANRVLTSTGTAPQWVTSLTGLTGVLSSSLTNTSLTSGRVVLSTAGGQQTDDADLTFDGTTLSAGGLSTTGFSTQVKTVTLGNSNFNGTAIFAPGTPAKLFLGTGVVTDVTSAAASTNTTGAIASLAITPIAATNASVTYTNAATLYIAGAPSASTNVTITNPYALYVAAGDAFFGGTVTAGTVNLTTLDLTNLEVTNIKAKDGTAAITLADSTGVATFAANPIINGGTANGVAFLDASKVLTTGSALTFDGTNFATTGSGTLKNLLLSGGALPGAGTPSISLRSSDNVVYHQSGSANSIVMLDSAQNTMQSIGATAQIYNISNAEQMRLTSTGLGIGTSSPVAGTKLTLQESASSPTALSLLNRNSTQHWKIAVDAAAVDDKILAFIDNATSSVRLALTDTGNLGLGVTPSAWFASNKAFQIGSTGCLSNFTSGSNIQTFLSNNVVWNSVGTIAYLTTNTATSYTQDNGTHKFYIAPSGTAGDAITFSQAMTLDANGSLVVGGTTVVTNNGGITATTTSSGSVASTLAMRNAGTANGSGTTLAFRGVSNVGAEHDYAYVTMVADDTTAKTGSIRFSTTAGSSPIERARIDSSGNVGIGTSSPIGRLEAVSGTGAGFNGWFRTGDATAANNAGGGFYNTSSATAASRSAIMGLDADGANLSGGDYFIIQKNGNSGTADILQYSNAAIRFGANYTNRAAIDMTLDPSGNLGLGVTPSAWSASFGIKVFDISGGAVYGSSSDVNMVWNGVYNTSNQWAYKTSATANLYTQDGAHKWYIAPSGTAGNAITFTQAMTLDSSGNLLVGTTTAGTMSGNGVVGVGARGGIITNSAAGVAPSGTLDIAINTGGGGYQGFLIVNNTVESNASSRTHTTFSVFGRGTDSSIQQIATDDGTSGPAAFTVTTPSNGVIRVTNTSGNTTSVAIQFFGGTSF